MNRLDENSVEKQKQDLLAPRQSEVNESETDSAGGANLTSGSSGSTANWLETSDWVNFLKVQKSKSANLRSDIASYFRTTNTVALVSI